MKQYRLLTPGPLTTTDSVKQEMLIDRCTWDEEYKALTQEIRKDLLGLAGVDGDTHTVVLMQGSGTFAVEATLTTTVRSGEKLLVLVNGAYGRRMVTIAERVGISHTVHEVPFHLPLSADDLADILERHTDITHIAFVHCETTTGILNPIVDLSRVVKAHGKILIVDAMSSFGGVPIPMAELDLDYLVSSSNKCIQGVPGFGFVIGKKDHLSTCRGVSRSLSLDLHEQWLEMEDTGKWRFTSPTHTVAAFKKALDELEDEGGIIERNRRYTQSNATLRAGMATMGFKAYVDESYQSPIITTFLHPDDDFEFQPFYEYVKANGYVLYPGKLMEVASFRIGNIGDLDAAHMEELLEIIRRYMDRR